MTTWLEKVRQSFDDGSTTFEKVAQFSLWLAMLLMVITAGIAAYYHH